MRLSGVLLLLKPEFPAGEKTIGASPDSSGRPRLVLAAYLAAFLLAVAGPWVVIGVQEPVRYGPAPEKLWPWTALFTLLHAAALVALILLASHPAMQAARESLALRPKARGVAIVAAAVLTGVLGAVLLVDLAAYLRLMWLDPISPLQGDMLPLIEMSLRSFWADHRFPYHFYDVAYWEIPLTYFPGVWLPYTVPWMLGVDIRILGAASFAAMGAMLLALFLRRAAAARDGLALVEAFPLAFLCLAIMHIPAYRGFLPALHVLPFWLFVVCWGVYFINRSWFVSGLFLGLCAAGRPYMIVVAPLLLMWAARNWRGERRGVLLHALGAAIPCVVLGAPFFLVDPRAFLFGVLEWYDFASQFHLEAERWRTHGFGFSGVLWELSGARTAPPFTWKMPIAWAVQAALWAIAWPRIQSPAQMLRLSAAALFAMLWFAVIPFFYAYTAPMLLIAIAQAHRGDSDASSASDTSPAWRVWMRWGFASVALASLAILLGVAQFAPPRPERLAGLNGEMLLVEQIKLVRGFDNDGWAANTLAAGHRVADTHAFLGVPCIEQASRAVEIWFDVESPQPGAAAEVYLNGEPLGVLPLDVPPGEPRVLPLPRKSLYRGTNMMRLRLVRDGARLPPEDAAALGLRLWQVRFAPPPELRFELRP